MTPLEYLRLHRHTKPADPPNGGIPLDLPSDATVGVVLVGTGGPGNVEELTAFFEQIFMDPVAVRIPLGPAQRERAARWLAGRRARQVRGQFEAIGGHSPAARLAVEQAGALQRCLDGGPIPFKVTTAMRYGSPSTEDAFRTLSAAGVHHAVLVPLYPQYSPTRTGSSLAYWRAVAERGGAQMTAVTSFADDPRFHQALSERIDEGLHRFPRNIRDHVHLLFVAHGLGQLERRIKNNPYCCEVHRTVDGVMRNREQAGGFSLSFQEQPGRRVGMEPRLDRSIDDLGAAAVRGVLAVPVSYTTDRIDSAYRLEVALRQRAEDAGIPHYHVVAPLNGHPLFVEGLAHRVRALVRIDGATLAPPVPDSADAGCPRPEWNGRVRPAAAGPGCGRCPHRAA